MRTSFDLPESKRMEMLSVARRPVTLLSRSETLGEGRHAEPLETLPPSRTLTSPSRLLTTIFTCTVPPPTKKKRRFQSPKAKHIGGPLPAHPFGGEREHFLPARWTPKGPLPATKR